MRALVAGAVCLASGALAAWLGYFVFTRRAFRAVERLGAAERTVELSRLIQRATFSAIALGAVVGVIAAIVCAQSMAKRAKASAAASAASPSKPKSARPSARGR